MPLFSITPSVSHVRMIRNLYKPVGFVADLKTVTFRCCVPPNLSVQTKEKRDLDVIYWALLTRNHCACRRSAAVWARARRRRLGINEVKDEGVQVRQARDQSQTHPSGWQQ